MHNYMFTENHPLSLILSFFFTHFLFFCLSLSCFLPLSLLCVCLGEKPVWEDGFFDHDSFVETLQPWAQTVVCGRARLGGVPVGVIAVETRAVAVIEPADPANPQSESKVS